MGMSVSDSRDASYTGSNDGIYQGFTFTFWTGYRGADMGLWLFSPRFQNFRLLSIVEACLVPFAEGCSWMSAFA